MAGANALVAALIITALSLLHDNILASAAVPDPCQFYGRIYWESTRSLADVKIYVVTAFPDIKVKNFTAFADGPGEWRYESTRSLADWKVYVTSFRSEADYEIQWVTAFPEVKGDWCTTGCSAPVHDQCSELGNSAAVAQSDGTCSCECSPGFTGENCDVCVEDSSLCPNWDDSTCDCDCQCQNGGVQVWDGECSCICFEPWMGELCDECANWCQNNGTVADATTCDTCDCPLGCANGGLLYGDCGCFCQNLWSGALCEECELSCGLGRVISDSCECDCGRLSCAHGTLNSTCGCECEPNWGGEFCDSCLLEECSNGGTIDQASCSCNCDSASSCANEGSHDDRCDCSCSRGFSGTLCEICDIACACDTRVNTTSCECMCPSNFHSICEVDTITLQDDCSCPTTSCSTLNWLSDLMGSSASRKPSSLSLWVVALLVAFAFGGPYT